MSPSHPWQLSGHHPAQWWGPLWDMPARPDLPRLIETGFLSPAVAGLLATLVQRQASIAVVAVPSGAGKTTLLSALMDLNLDGDVSPRRRIYLQGSYERFAFLDDPDVTPETTVLLVNEISSHLPHYLWGPAVERLLQLGGQGFQIAATAHARDAREFVAMLAAPPLRIRPVLTAAFSIIVCLEATRDHLAIHRRLSGVWALAPGRQDSVVILPLADGSDSLEIIDSRLEAVRDLEHEPFATLTIAEVERVMREPGVVIPAAPGPYPPNHPPRIS